MICIQMYSLDLGYFDYLPVVLEREIVITLRTKSETFMN